MTKLEIEKLAEKYCIDKYGTPMGNKPSWDAFIAGFELALSRLPAIKTADGQKCAKCREFCN